jgi:hypothetical protein
MTGNVDTEIGRNKKETSTNDSTMLLCAISIIMRELHCINSNDKRLFLPML